KTPLKKEILEIFGVLVFALVLGGPCAAQDEKAGAVHKDLSEHAVLQRLQLSPGKLADGRFYVPATLQTIKWGYLPNRKAKAIFTVPSGSLVTFDTLSGE